MPKLCATVLRVPQRLAPITAALLVVASCYSDDRSVTGATRPRTPAAAVGVLSLETLSPAADTRLNLNAVNYSLDTIVTLYTWPDNKIANAILMQFDLASIPPGSTISSATLNLYLTDADVTPDPTYTVTVHEVVNKNPILADATGYTYDGVNSWTANECCLNSIPLAQADIGPAVDTRDVDKALGFKQWNVTSILQNWIANPGANFGLLVNSDPSKLADRWRYFASSDHPTPSQRPYLEVVYTGPSAPGTVTDLAVNSTTDNSATLSFTEVDDGTGQPAQYFMRYAPPPIAWGSATDVTEGSCQVPMAGTAIGASRTCTVEGLASSTEYDFQVVAFRGTLNQDAVFGELSNVAAGTTGAPPPPPPGVWPNEPPGFTTIEDTGWELGTFGSWYLKNDDSPTKRITVEDITDSPIGEARALQISYDAGHVGGGGVELAYDIAPQNQGFEMFVGYYVQVNAQWDGHDSAINKMIYLYDGDDFTWTAMWYEMFGAGSEPLGLYVVNQSGADQGFHENVTPVEFTRGAWHRVEIYQKQGNPGVIRVWVDGVLAIDRADVITRDAPLSGVTISGIWGGVGDAKSQFDYMRFDRMHVSVP